MDRKEILKNYPRGIGLFFIGFTVLVLGLIIEIQSYIKGVGLLFLIIGTVIFFKYHDEYIKLLKSVK